MRTTLSTLLKQMLALSAIAMFIASPIGCGDAKTDAKTGDMASEHGDSPEDHGDAGSGMRNGSGTQGGGDTKTDAKTDEKADEKAESKAE